MLTSDVVFEKFIGDASNTTWDIHVEYLNDVDNLQVTYFRDSDQTEFILNNEPNTYYTVEDKKITTVDGAALSDGSNFVSPMPVDDYLTITTRAEYKQETHITSNSSYNPATLERAYDHSVMLARQNKEKLSRSIYLAVSDTGQELLLPPIVSGLGKYLALDENGNAVWASGTESSSLVADQALAEAQYNTGLLADIASDSEISPTEKPNLIQIVDSINTEEPIIVARALEYVISSTVYETAVSDLNAYLATLTTWTDWNNTSGTTTVVRTTFNLKFQDVYTERQTLLDAILEKAKDLADAAQVDATGALNQISDMNDDGKITPIEKIVLLRLWKQIDKDHTNVLTMATDAGLSTGDGEYDLFVSTYDLLYGFLYTSPGVLINMTTVSTVSNITLDGVIEDYQDARSLLITAISQIQNTGIANTPTYEEVDPWWITGNIPTPTTPTLTATGWFKSISLTFDVQTDLQWFKQFNLQVSSDQTNWYSLGLDGIDWKATIDAWTPIEDHKFVHTDLPLTDGTGITLYYRAKRVTRDGLESSVSTVVSGTIYGIQSTVIEDDAITTPKIITGAVVTDKLDALAVTAAKIDSLAVTTDKLDAGAATADKITLIGETGTSLTTALQTTEDNAVQALSDAADAQSTADGKIIAYYQDNEPANGNEGDIWFDTNDGNKIYVYNTGAWVESQDNDIALAINDAQTAQTTADGKAEVFYQTTAPTGMAEGDIWVDTDDDYKTYVYSGSAWVAPSTVDGLQALSDAAAAQSTADGQIVGFYQDAEPTTGMSFGDIWIDTDGHTPPNSTDIYRYEDINGESALTLDWYTASTNAIGLVYLDAYNAQETADDAQLSVDQVENIVNQKEDVFLESFEYTSGSNFDDFYNFNSSNGERSIIVDSDAEKGGKSLSIGNNSGDDQIWVESKVNIPLDPTKLYRIRVRVKRTAGTGGVYIGCNGIAADGTTRINKVGDDTFGDQHYFCLSNGYPLTSYSEYIAYFKGISATAGGISRDPANPKHFYTGVKYFRPMFLVNYNGEAGTTVIDYIIIEDYTDAYNAQVTADTKIVTFYQTSFPTTGEVGDLWIDTDADNTLYRHNGGTAGTIADWTLARDVTDVEEARVTSIAPGVISTGLVNATEAMIIGFNGTGTVTSPNEKDRRVYIDDDEIGFEEYTGGAWSTVNSIKIGGVDSNSLFYPFLQCRGVLNPLADEVSQEFFPGGRVLNFEGDLADQNGDLPDTQAYVLTSTVWSKFGTKCLISEAAGTPFISYSDDIDFTKSMGVGYWCKLVEGATGTMVIMRRYYDANNLVHCDMWTDSDGTLNGRFYIVESGSVTDLRISGLPTLSFNTVYYFSMGWRADVSKFYLTVNGAEYNLTVSSFNQPATTTATFFRASSSEVTGKKWYIDELFFNVSADINPDLFIQHYNHNVPWNTDASAKDIILKPADGGVSRSGIDEIMTKVSKQTCKAWVNFNGTGTVAIRDSYNVSSITDNGIGDYTVNFTNAMSDTDYSYSVNSEIQLSTSYYFQADRKHSGLKTTTQFQVLRTYNKTGVDPEMMSVHIFAT